MKQYGTWYKQNLDSTYPDLRLPVTGQWAEAQVGPGNNYITSMFVTIFRSQMSQLLALVPLSMYIYIKNC